MGIFRKEWKTVMTNFLSSKANLTIFQCLMYFVIGYVMGQHLTWIELSVMFVVMFVTPGFLFAVLSFLY